MITAERNWLPLFEDTEDGWEEELDEIIQDIEDNEDIDSMGDIDIMGRHHPEWSKFIDLLKEALHLKKYGEEWKWDCDSSNEKPLTRKILENNYPDIDIEATMDYFTSNGCSCDCEIVLYLSDFSEEM